MLVSKYASQKRKTHHSRGIRVINHASCEFDYSAFGHAVNMKLDIRYPSGLEAADVKVESMN